MGGIEFGEILGGVFVEGADAALAAEAEQAVAVERVDHILQLVPGDEAGFERVGGGEFLGLGFFNNFKKAL